MTVTTKVIPSDKLFVSEPDPRWFGNEPNPTEGTEPTWTNDNWLKSRFHFSFADYNSYQNLDFGDLRVLNDDLVQPHRGFGAHNHRNMEIITYIVDGELTHEDSMGTNETLGRGSIQFMTAGRGVEHSEFNYGDKPLRFIQMWVKPSKGWLIPNYGSYTGAARAKNQLHHLVSDINDMTTKTPVEISQNVDIYASEIEGGRSVRIDLSEGRQAYLVCIEGNIRVNGGKVIKRHGACEITGTGGPVVIECVRPEATPNGELAHVLLLTMRAVHGSGRSDI